MDWSKTATQFNSYRNRALTKKTTNPDDELSPQFASALKRIEHIGFLIDNEL